MTASSRPFVRGIFCSAVALGALAAPLAARAAAPTTPECLSANDQAISLRREHKLIEARAALLICAADSCPAEVRTECSARVADLNAALPTIVFDAKDASGKDLSAVKVTLDGQPLANRLDGTALPVNPGQHTFVFEAEGMPPVTEQLVIREAEKNRQENVKLGAALPASPGPAPAVAAAPGAAAPSSDRSRAGSSQRTFALVAAGVGVVGVGLGSAFGLSAISKKSSAHQACPDQCSNPSDASAWHDAKTAGNVSTALFIVGGVGLAAGAALWFTAPHASEQTQVGIGLGGVALKGSF